MLGPTPALAQPSQHPLITGSTGARPNIIISLDNSSSMGMVTTDAYRVKADGEDVAFSGDGADMANPKAAGYYWAQRSADANPMYYNPRFTYEPRVLENNQPMVANDGILFISNAASSGLDYSEWAESEAKILSGTNPVRIDANFPAYPSQPTVPAGWLKTVSISSDVRTPINQPHGQLDASTPAFSYATCSVVSFSKTYGQFCKPSQIVTIRHDSTAPIVLPAGERRTDCKSTATPKTCTPAEEIQNIINWYRYYSNRITATATALGIAFQDKRLSDGIARIGYRQISLRTDSSYNAHTLGYDTDKPFAARGVRPWVRGSAANQQFYDWLYHVPTFSGTPLITSYYNVGRYLSVPAGQKENPWARDPSQPKSESNPELSCRRSYHIMFSDGAWYDGGYPSGIVDNADSVEGPEFTQGTTRAGQQARTFKYQPQGLDNDRFSYIPYPSKSTKGLADLAAHFYWHTDLRPDLPNDVPTRAGQPTFWQNMQTYAIGYMISASGDPTSNDSLLRFSQIDAYRYDYLSKGFADAKQPVWPEVAFVGTASNEAPKIDDFIQSGYTGGGRSFSVYTPSEIRAALGNILSDILDASGNDAGIGLTASPVAGNSLEGRLKFKVDYRTTDNIGNIIAQKLDPNGNPVLLDTNANGQTLNPKSDVYWSARDLIPSPADRKIFTMSKNGQGTPLQGNLKSLAPDLWNQLPDGPMKTGLPEDSSFVDYLRGKDPVVDKNGQTYRLRVSRIGAIVNSTPVLMSFSQNYGYEGQASTVSGASRYADFRKAISNTSDTLYVATNAGTVHALQAANGQEIAAFVPRRALPRLVEQAQTGSEFQYVLDGPLSLHDVYDGSSWHQLVIGTGGRGARLIYSLRPRLVGNGGLQLTPTDYLWETGPDVIDTANDGDNMPFASGHMSNPARGGYTESNHWVTVLNSGHHNGHADGSRHGLVVLNAMTGQVLRTISLPSAYSAGRGLGGVTLVRDNRKRIVAAYAGDANGHLWRFDLRGDPSTWKVSYGKPLFTTPDARPIYAAPAWQAHPKGGMMVVLATGMVLDESDPSDTAKREGIFGIWDPTSRVDGTEKPGFDTVLPDQLLEQEVQDLKASVDDKSYYAISSKRIQWDGPDARRGWKLMLGGKDGQGGMKYRGERVIDQVANAGSSVLITSVVIDRSDTAEESCTGSTSPPGAVYVLNALDGAAQRAFDHNGDGRRDDVSMVFTSSGGYSRGTAMINPKDPATMTATQLAESKVAAAHGESLYDNTECRSASFKIVGVNDGAIGGGVSCPTGWSRQQYQLTQVPQ